MTTPERRTIVRTIFLDWTWKCTELHFNHNNLWSQSKYMLCLQTILDFSSEAWGCRFTEPPEGGTSDNCRAIRRLTAGSSSLHSTVDALPVLKLFRTELYKQDVGSRSLVCKWSKIFLTSKEKIFLKLPINVLEVILWPPLKSATEFCQLW